MKKGDMRRAELLATAERLFYSRGYEKTSVQDILTEIGFSKGGFYHHFDSKLSVLEAICEMRAQECCERAKQAAGGAKMTACERLNAFFHDAAMLTSENRGFVALLIQVAYRGDGALMRDKMKNSQLERLQPIVASIIEQGVKKKEFFVEDTDAYAQLLMRMYLELTDEMAMLLADEEREDVLMEKMIRSLRAYRAAVERILIAPFGSIVLFEAQEIQVLAREMLQHRRG